MGAAEESAGSERQGFASGARGGWQGGGDEETGLIAILESSDVRSPADVPIIWDTGVDAQS